MCSNFNKVHVLLHLSPSHYAQLQQIGGAECTFPACISIKPEGGSKCFKRCVEIVNSDGNSEVEVPAAWSHF